MFELVSIVYLLNNPNPNFDSLGIYETKEECIAQRDSLVEYSKTQEFQDQIKDVEIDSVMVGCVAKEKSLFL